MFVNAEPGVILTAGQREFCRSWKEQEGVTVHGAHFVQEGLPTRDRKPSLLLTRR